MFSLERLQYFTVVGNKIPCAVNICSVGSLTTCLKLGNCGYGILSILLCSIPEATDGLDKTQAEAATTKTELSELMCGIFGSANPTPTNAQ